MANSTIPYETCVTSTDVDGGRVTVGDVSDMTKLLIRTKRMPVGKYGRATPPGLPRQGRAFIGGEVLIAATRPAEWTVLCARGRGVSHLVPAEATIVDLTHGRSAIRVSGIGAPELLAQLCSVDFADDFTPNGAVISGSVASVMCDIIRDDLYGSPSYLLLVDRSFAVWLSAQLVDVAQYLNHFPLKGQK